MPIVTMEFKEYDNMLKRQERSDKKISYMVESEQRLKKDHEKELWELAEGEKVLYVEKEKNQITAVNLEDIRKEVEEHYKNGCYEEEIQNRVKGLHTKYNELVDDYDALCNKYDAVEKENQKFKDMNFFERLRYLFTNKIN